MWHRPRERSGCGTGQGRDLDVAPAKGEPWMWHRPRESPGCGTGHGRALDVAHAKGEPWRQDRDDSMRKSDPDHHNSPTSVHLQCLNLAVAHWPVGTHNSQAPKYSHFHRKPDTKYILCLRADVKKMASNYMLLLDVQFKLPPEPPVNWVCFEPTPNNLSVTFSHSCRTNLFGMRRSSKKTLPHCLPVLIQGRTHLTSWRFNSI